MCDLTHFDESGASRMVDVGDKPVTRRVARASGRVRMAAATLNRMGARGQGPGARKRTTEPRSQTPDPRPLAKGDVLEVARLAGIMAAKRTADLIPLCHPLPLDAVAVTFDFVDDETLSIEATVEVEAKTGVEMEALTAVSVAALTVYDMTKSIDRGITIGPIRLEEKSGGRSGHWRREA